MSFRPDRAFAAALDVADPLASFRGEFFIPARQDGTPLAYFCGHSLGLQPRRAALLVEEEMAAWRQHAVEGHFTGERPWLSYHEKLAPALAILAGARPEEVVAMNSLTVNLHLMLTSFYRPTRARYKLLIEQQVFPSDRYAVDSHARLHGFDPAEAVIEIGPRAGESFIRDEDLAALLEREGSSIATVMLPGVQYLSGQCFDLREITTLARRQGCIVGFDLAHAMGNVPLQLHDWQVDFAVWCGYKYLNGGPGAIGGCFVHERHAREFTLPRFAGWWGHDKSTRFAMPPVFKPLPGAEGWQLSNPSILSAAPLLGSLQLFSTAGMQRLRAKSVQLTGYFEYLLQEQLRDRITVLTPTDANARGCQLSLRLNADRDRARAVHAALDTQGFRCDWREPDVIRAAPVPLYNSFSEVWQLVQALDREMR